MFVLPIILQRFILGLNIYVGAVNISWLSVGFDIVKTVSSTLTVISSQKRTHSPTEDIFCSAL